VPPHKIVSRELPRIIEQETKGGEPNRRNIFLQLQFEICVKLAPHVLERAPGMVESDTFELTNRVIAGVNCVVH
jgi:hypothetical protein